jgi:hypothetical protein
VEEARLFHRALDDGGQRLVLEGLGEIILGPLLHGSDGAMDRGERRHHDEDGTMQGALRLLHERDAVEARHLEVGEDDVRRKLLQLSERLEAVGGRLDSIALVAQNLAQCGAGVGLVVDDENAVARGHPDKIPRHGTDVQSRPPGASQCASFCNTPQPKSMNSF